MSTLCEVVTSPVFNLTDAIKSSNVEHSEVRSDSCLRHESAHDSKCSVSCAQSVKVNQSESSEDKRKTEEAMDGQKKNNEKVQDNSHSEPKRKKSKSRMRKSKFWRRRPYHRNFDSSKRYLFPLSSQEQCEKPLAPFNTTQFLMDDHNDREPEVAEINRLLHRSGMNESRPISESANVNEETEQFYSSPEDELDFIKKQFLETYENVHTERLNSMSKSELVQEYRLLEERMEELEKKLKHSSSEGQPSPIKIDEQLRSDEVSEDSERSESLVDEVNRLQEENKKLLSSNEKLMCIINSNRENPTDDGSCLVDTAVCESESDTSQRGFTGSREV